MSRPSDGRLPLRVAVAGCGAVTRLYGAPALARLVRSGAAEVTAVFDPDPSAVAAVRTILPGAAAADSFEALLAAGADLAIVASPPRLHAAQAIAASRAGLAVLVEKPMALTVGEADAMIAEAEAAGRPLAVGLVRRHLPATRAIAALIASGAIGRVLSVDWFEGGPFDWPVASPAYFTRAVSGGGVMQDIGTHVIDLLGWWFGPASDVRYEDDAMGGVEANCRLTGRFGGVPVVLRLSRDWARPNRAIITGERGRIVWTANEPGAFDLDLDDGAGTVPIAAAVNGAADFVDAFARQYSDMADAIRTGRAPAVPGSIGRETLALIEAAVADRRPMAMGWLSPEEAAGRVRAAGGAP
jgi:predicted dehydrogenase